MMMANLHTVAPCADVLLVRCTACQRRAALGKDKTKCHQGNMKPVYELRLKCAGCGARNSGQPGDKTFALYIPHTLDEAKDFLAGHELERRRAQT